MQVRRVAITASWGTSLIALLLAGLFAQGQSIDVVSSVSLSAYQGKSYLFKSGVTLSPGFVITGSPSASFFCSALGNQPSSLDQNFIREETILIDGVATDNEISLLPLVDKQTTFEYVDGLGRKLQTIQKEGSPRQMDIVSPVKYDEFGRLVNEFLPYVRNEGLGTYQIEDAWIGSFGAQVSFYDGTHGVADDEKPYAEITFDDSPLNAVRKRMGPGSAWHSANKGVSNLLKVDKSGTVKRWTYVSETVPPAPPGTYAQFLLQYTQVTDEGGVETLEYKDYRGLTILSVRDAQGLKLETYNVYDVMGRLRLVFPPEASDKVATKPLEYENASEADRMSFVNRWCFQYVYDDLGRLIKKRAPGMDDWTLMVYDKWDRLVLTREPGWPANQWSFTKYDELNRPILTGTYSTSSTHTQLQNSAMLGGRYESVASGIISYTLTATFPAVTESDVLTVTYYDNYDFLGPTKWNAGSIFDFVAEAGFAPPTELLNPTKGQITGSRVRVLNASTWLRTVTRYDKRYRTLQTIGENHLGGFDRVTNFYDFAGRLLKTRTTHSSTGHPPLAVLKEMTYDHAGRLLTIAQTIGSGPAVLVASNQYNELGQLVEKNLHSTDGGSSFLQSIDYHYNIRGWISNINNSKLTASGSNNDSNDLFGMDILYHEPDENGFTADAKYNGNISAIRWKTNNLKDSPVGRIFGFAYDNVDRLLRTQYGELNGSSWDPVASNRFSENMNYDRNGNIVTLNRNYSYGGTTTQVDNLTYRYSDLTDNDKGNRLINVKDHSSYWNLADNNPANGYAEASTATDPLLTEYVYDASGRMMSDANRGVTSIGYNHLNMPEFIQFSGSRRIEYLYDAAGNKLRSKVVENTTPLYQTDYVGNFSYVNGQLSFIGMDEGRAVKNAAGTYDYEYFLKDHQGNTRLTFAALKETKEYKATMEPLLSSQEEYQLPSNPDGFRNIPAGRVTMFNHTSKTPATPLPDKSAETNGSMVGKAIGPAKTLAVTASDRIQVEVFARYSTAVGSNTALVTGLSGLVTGAFGLTGGEAFTSLSNAVPGQAASIPFTGGAPKAYVCYLLFESPDPNTFIFRQFGFSKISTAAAAGHERLFIDAVMPYSGVVYIYVVNESNVSSATSVYFDDLSIVHEKSNTALQVLQSSDYLPFGLSFNEYYQSRALTSPGTYYPQNKFQFQGQERQTGFDMGLYHFKYRMHDPAIGRFGLVDPLADQYVYNSSYAFSENRLIDGIELEGKEYLSLENSGLNLASLGGAGLNGYNFSLGGLNFTNVPLVTENGISYFNIGYDLYYGNSGWSRYGSFSEIMTEWIYSGVGPTIQENQFVGWGDVVDSQTCDDCFKCCTMQLDQVGLQSKSSDQRVQLFSNDGTANSETIYRGLSYIHKALENGDAIRVGLDYNGRNGLGNTNNVDELTDHFVTIVDRGRDAIGPYFRFYENATGAGGEFGQPGRDGTSLTNRLYVGTNGEITGNSVWIDGLRLTMVRPNTNQN